MSDKEAASSVDDDEGDKILLACSSEMAEEGVVDQKMVGPRRDQKDKNNIMCSSGSNIKTLLLRKRQHNVRFLK